MPRRIALAASIAYAKGARHTLDPAAAFGSPALENWPERRLRGRRNFAVVQATDCDHKSYSMLYAQ
jgi:hypothetical protein